MNKPNILWICTDQQRFDSLRCYGNEKIDTPNIDKLSKTGVLFENTYCQSPVCSPSRASFLTSRYPRTCRLRENGQKIPNDELLVSKVYKDNGYNTGLVGKLHLAPCNTEVCKTTEERIDDGYSIFNWSHHPDFKNAKSNWPLNEYNMWLESESNEYLRMPYNSSKYVYVGPDTEYSHSHWCAKKAKEFIGAHEGQDIPWFLSVNMYDPHHDFDPPKNLLEKYIKRLNKDDLPNYVEDELENKPIYQKYDHVGAGGVIGNFNYEEMSEKDHIEIKAAYYAMVEQVDIEVGNIIEKLKSTNQYKNTVIVFTSDHGEMLGDHGIYLKGPYFYDPMVKVPLIISYPEKLQSNIKRKALVELIDLAPTLLEISEISIPECMQGKSLLNLLSSNNTNDIHNESVYCEFYEAMARPGKEQAYGTMVATNNYKLSYYHSCNFGELYDIKNDKNETKNLYYDKEYLNIKIKLLEELANKMASTIDPMPIRTAQY